MRPLLRLTGHGVAVTPRPPFALERHGGRGGDAVVVTHRVPGGLPRRIVVVPGPAGCAVEPGGGVDPAGVAEVSAGPASPRWTLAGDGFALEWPASFQVESSPAPDHPPGFDLVAPGGLLLVLHGPLAGEPARPEALLAPGLRVRAQGEAGDAAWCEVEYQQEQALWRQRVIAVRLERGSLVAALRAPVQSVDTPAWAAALDGVSTLRPA
jgi:hypothetical protein